LEQKHRDFQAEIETSARLKQENMALQEEVVLLRKTLQEVKHQKDALTCVSAY
jgi:predicted RNase H-like nuclease (RuvC/YqgF family)